MLDAVRERIRAQLATQGVGVLSVSSGQMAWATPVRYRVEGLELDCLVPRWTDAAYHLEQNPCVLLVILGWAIAGAGQPLRWLAYRGTARPVATPVWGGLLPDGAQQSLAGDLYLVAHVSPERIDLIDESWGWGVRETLEL